MIEIDNPWGATGPSGRALTPAPPLLAGKRIVVLGNRKPNSELLMMRMAEQLANRTGATVEFIPKGNAAEAAEPDVLAKVRLSADVVVTGSAD